MPPAAIPNPTGLYRLVHVDNLATLLTRGVLHAPHSTPNDGLTYRSIHNVSVQASRNVRPIPCGPGGTIHDYLPFYFGPLSVMLLNLKTGRVAGYTEGQEPLVYLLTTAQVVEQAGCRFVFSDGHGLAGFTHWYDDLAQLDQVDWNIVGERYWSDKPDDNDRQRRKQAEFLAWQSLDWSLIRGIVVLNAAMQQRVENILSQFPLRTRPQVAVKPGWYY
ncbi:type II toxin-antitoxin system toxin DNA ADP-ribosyl transferase DarT [Chitinimonas sp. PSY-7]|uniref:type II toxin-antitoxin system toxin DNA ADP-ribosyl transferase DarT n=1 Tax=Chitinimonas sp. PSY-7 TaxID=3459088 RepID=UPI0040402D87